MDNRTLEEVRNNETRLISEIKELELKNKKYKEVIDKLSESIEGHYDGFTTINEFGACNDIIELLLEFKEILKEVK